ncbi:Unknown protein sequence [Pseudomonas syringae pv. maculicola]|nr:Unknown protein sequence [Pseudomonas syringae pv. maculicola]
MQENSVHHARSHKKAAQHPAGQSLVRRDRQVRKQQKRCRLAHGRAHHRVST